MKAVIPCFYSSAFVVLLLSKLGTSIAGSSNHSRIDGSQQNLVDELEWPESTNPIDFSSWKTSDQRSLISKSSSESSKAEHPQNQIVQRFTEKWDESELHELTHRDRYATSDTVDYGGSHPYEVMERHRHLSGQQQISSTHPDVDGRNLQLPPWQSNAVYQNIRITLDTKYLPEKSVTYSEKVSLLKNEILPEVRQFWSSALRVYPINGNLKVSASYCPYSDITQTTVGVPNTDLLVLVAANVKSICDNGAYAAARSCQADQYDRPIVGSAVVCLDKMNMEDETVKETFKTVLIHEIGHVLGVRAVDFAYYYDSNTGMPRTPRPFVTEQRTCVDGVVADVIAPSLNTMRQGRTKRGNLYYELVMPAVKSVARNQFNCHTMTGARLENQPTNNGNCFGTHWEARLYVSELLSAITTQTKQVVSPLTLAVLEDSGWYRPDYSVAQISPFGHGRGCDFVYEDCIDENGNVPKWGEGFFCNEKLGPQSRLQCDGTHQYVSRCDLVDYADYPSSVPPNERYQYWRDHTTWGGLLHTAAYCPMPSMVVTGTNADGIFEFDCTDTDLKSNVEPEYFGDDSNCYETNLARPICMQTFCDEVNFKVNVIVGNSDVIVCENEGDWKTIPGLSQSSKFQCPPIAVVCPNLICPSNCSGRGVCDYRQKDPVCICCDPNDRSPSCENSPIGCEYDFNDGKVQSPVPLPVSYPIAVPVPQPTRPTGGAEYPYPTKTDTGFGGGEYPNLAPSGPSGPSGPSRPSGPSGPSGPTGPTGPSGTYPVPSSSGAGAYPSPSKMGPPNSGQTRPTYPNPSPVRAPFYPYSVNDDFFSNENQPTAQPSPLPRDVTSVTFTFCIEHSIITPLFQIVDDTSSSITETLTGLFNDNVKVIDDWSIEEEHLRVTNVNSIWLEDPPENFECKCEAGDTTSVCSSIESTVEVSFWNKLDPEEVKYLLLYFGQFLAGGMIHKAKIWGVEAVSTIVQTAVYGVPAGNMSPSSQAKFEQSFKDFLSSKVSASGVDLQIMSVRVQNVAPILPSRLLMHEKRALKESGVDITTFVTGQYTPPPHIDFKKLLEEIMNENSSELTDELVTSGDPYFKDVKQVFNGGRSISPTMSPTTLEELGKSRTDGGEDGEGGGGGSKVGMILGIIVGILALIAAAVAGLIYYKRRNDIDSKFDPDDFEPQKSLYEINPLDEEATVSTMYGGRYDTSTYDESKDEDAQTFLTDPSFRKSARTLQDNEDGQSTYSEDEFRSYSRSGGNSYRGHRSSDTSYTIGDDSYVSGPSQSYSYVQGSNDSFTEDSSFVTGLSKKSYAPVKRYSDGESTYGESRYGDPPPYAADPDASLDPPEEKDDEEEDDDLGTFAGQSIHKKSLNDDVSAISFRGVEDSWCDSGTMDFVDTMENIAEEGAEEDEFEYHLPTESAKDSSISSYSILSEKVESKNSYGGALVTLNERSESECSALVEAPLDSKQSEHGSENLNQDSTLESSLGILSIGSENSNLKPHTHALVAMDPKTSAESNSHLLENSNTLSTEDPTPDEPRSSEPPGRRASMIDSQAFDPYSSFRQEPTTSPNNQITPNESNSTNNQPNSSSGGTLLLTNQSQTIPRQNPFSEINDAAPKLTRRSSLPSMTSANSFEPLSTENPSIATGMHRRNSLPSFSMYQNFDPFATARSVPLPIHDILSSNNQRKSSSSGNLLLLAHEHQMSSNQMSSNQMSSNQITNQIVPVQRQNPFAQTAEASTNSLALDLVSLQDSIPPTHDSSSVFTDTNEVDGMQRSVMSID